MSEFPKDKILNMSESQIKGLIMEINSIVGGNERTASRLASDIPGLKSQLSRMSDRDLQNLVNKVGADKADEIMRKLKGL